MQEEVWVTELGNRTWGMMHASLRAEIKRAVRYTGLWVNVSPNRKKCNKAPVRSCKGSRSTRTAAQRSPPPASSPSLRHARRLDADATVMHETHQEWSAAKVATRITTSGALLNTVTAAFEVCLSRLSSDALAVYWSTAGKVLVPNARRACKRFECRSTRSRRQRKST